MMSPSETHKDPLDGAIIETSDDTQGKISVFDSVVMNSRIGFFVEGL